MRERGPPCRARWPIRDRTPSTWSQQNDDESRIVCRSRNYAVSVLVDERRMRVQVRSRSRQMMFSTLGARALLQETGRRVVDPSSLSFSRSLVDFSVGRAAKVGQEGTSEATRGVPTGQVSPHSFEHCLVCPNNQVPWTARLKLRYRLSRSSQLVRGSPSSRHCRQYTASCYHLATQNAKARSSDTLFLARPS